MGFSIAELTKLLMYKFNYKYIKQKFDAKLLLTDTKKNDIYEKFFQDKNLFDFSEYPINSKFYDPTNKKVLGKMKDEFKGQIISGFAGLKSKVYSLTSVDDKKSE